MNEKNIPEYKNKKALIIGLDDAAIHTIFFLHSRGAKIKLSDNQSKEKLSNKLERLEKKDIPLELELGNHTESFCSDDVDFAIISPAIPKSSPFLKQVKKNNLPIHSSLDIALREINTPLIAFVGSHGKTSTIEITKQILESAGKKVFVDSDLHDHLINYLSSKKADFILLELSEAQLDKLGFLKPHTVVLSCLHKTKPIAYESIEDYYRNQFKILRDINDITNVVYNYRDTALRSIIPPFPGKKYLVRRKNPISVNENFYKNYQGAFLENTRKVGLKKEQSLSYYDLIRSSIFGLHQRDNLMLAVTVAKLFEVEDKIIQAIINKFRGIPHRLELVKKWEGVRFVNDSRSLTPNNLELSLKAFPYNTVILIAGGKSKPNASFAPLASLVKERVKTMILIGESKEQISRELGDNAETFLVGTFKEAILLSCQKSREGDVILFSPGSASYDMFKDYKERGYHFTRYLEEV